MLALAALCASSSMPAEAAEQFSLVVTEEDQRVSGDDSAYAATCAADACRASLPVHLGSDVCILNVRVDARNEAGSGRLSFAAGPCRSGRKMIAGPGFRPSYQLGSFGTTSITLRVPFLPATRRSELDDGVVHPAPVIRLDIIATRELAGSRTTTPPR